MVFAWLLHIRITIKTQNQVSQILRNHCSKLFGSCYRSNELSLQGGEGIFLIFHVLCFFFVTTRDHVGALERHLGVRNTVRMGPC
jgi:hypothetical protein